MRFQNLIAAAIAAIALLVASPANAQRVYGGMTPAEWSAARNSDAQALGAVGRPGLGLQGSYNRNIQFDEAYHLAKDERLAEAAVPSLVIVAVGLVPLLYVSKRYFQATRS